MPRESISLFDIFLLSIPYVAGFLIALIMYTIREFNRKKDIKEALKYEIFTNAHELIEFDRVAKILKDEYPLKSFIYSEPLFNAFNSMISNNLIGAIKKCKTSVFNIYSMFREYDLVYKKMINHIDILKERTDIKETIKRQKYKKQCEKAMKWSQSFKNRFENKIIANLNFLDKNDWKRFKNNIKKAK